MKEKNLVRRIKFFRVDARAKAFAFIDADGRLTFARKNQGNDSSAYK